MRGSYLQRRWLFEAYNKGAVLFPVDELPWYRVTWDQNDYADPILTEYPGIAKDVLHRIRDEGPLTALDFESGRTTNWFGTPMSVASAVLNAYAAKGVLGLARREGNRRYYGSYRAALPGRPSQEEGLAANSIGTRCFRGTVPMAYWASSVRP